MLGALKAGKFYVPLDPSFPKERIRSMVEDSEAKLIVTGGPIVATAREWVDPNTRLLTMADCESSRSGHNPDLPLSADTIAYVLYTSGSTGQPKGVAQSHRTQLQSIATCTNESRICVNDRLTLLHSPSTGSSVYHLFGALLNGAALLPFNIKAQGVAALAAWLRDEEITLYHSIPAVFRDFAATLPPTEEFPSVRLVQLSASPALRRDVELCRRHFGQECIFTHMMGSTEALFIAWYFAGEETGSGEHLPVGYPLEGKEIILLDDHGHEVSTHEVGQIAVRSRYLSLGYWGQPELTKDKFLPDPGGGDKRIYLTGDLGRRSD
ncbi:MAG: AMP-binding protein, partial [bacterium]